MTLRNAMPLEAIAAKSGEIVRRLKGLREIRESYTLMVYLSFGSEVLTDGLIVGAGMQGSGSSFLFAVRRGGVLTPCLLGGFAELETGHYGIREPKADRLRPVPREEIDAVLVPAVRF